MITNAINLLRELRDADGAIREASAK